jgi:hypothetical protein
MPFISSARNQYGPQGKKNTKYRLYQFSSHTFTNAGVTGISGPNLSQCRSAYSSAAWAQDSAYFNMTTNGIQEWTTPGVGNYRFTVAGARGGNGGGEDVGGAILRADIFLNANQKIYILVGQMGQDRDCAAGGGGGTFVAYANPSGNSTAWGVNVSPLIVAGGGSGSRNNSSPTYGQPGQMTTDGGGTGGGTSGGGANGGGGNGGGTGGAGGFVGNGGNGNNSSLGAFSFVNGGESRQNPSSRQVGGFGGGSTSTCEACNSAAHSGAGGGYSGGYGGSGSGGCYGTSGSGGSFILSTASNVATSTGSWTRGSTTSALASGSYGNLGGYNQGHGYVTVVRL